VSGLYGRTLISVCLPTIGTKNGLLRGLRPVVGRPQTQRTDFIDGNQRVSHSKHQRGQIELLTHKPQNKVHQVLAMFCFKHVLRMRRPGKYFQGLWVRRFLVEVHYALVGPFVP